MTHDDLQSTLRDMERVAQAAAKLQQSISRESNGAANAARTQPDDVLSATHRYARAHPWRTLCIATGLGFLVGSLLTRPKRE